jgi:2-methylisocitrate lyase-like PEP mutase family enzyme
MSTSEARARLRDALQGTECSVAVPVVDVLTARLAQEAGWEICKLNSSGMKATNYGLPDEVAGLVTISDYADVIRRIRRTVTDIAILVDADDCGGTPETVSRWVSDMEAAGVSGIEIEDRGYLPMSEMGKGLRAMVHPIDVQVANLKAAVAARDDPSTVIIARTCAFSPTQVDAIGMTTEGASERVRAYAETGVDAIMIPAQSSRVRTDIETIRRVTDLPQCVLRMPPDLIQDNKFLAANNVRLRYISQSTVFGQLVPYVYDIMKNLKDDRTGTAAMNEEDQMFGEVNRTSELGKGSGAALRLTTTPRYRHEFVN